VVTAIRRTSVLVSFAGGLLWFGERYGWRKALAVAGILLGLSLIILG
jgi:drug/metabolite transporter (DMT)-like permease